MRTIEPFTITTEEVVLATGLQQYLAAEKAYIAIQMTKPQSLAVALTDSPAELSGWIAEKLDAWTDHDGDLQSVLDKDDILANIRTYSLTRTALSSARMHRDSVLNGTASPVPRHVEVPTGVGTSPKELCRFSRRQAEKSYNGVRRTGQVKGGHFAALEQPELFVNDVRAYFGERR